jgi:hypothetical protein
MKPSPAEVKTYPGLVRSSLTGTAVGLFLESKIPAPKFRKSSREDRRVDGGCCKVQDLQTKPLLSCPSSIPTEDMMLILTRGI